jgi:hypothetical protein
MNGDTKLELAKVVCLKGLDLKKSGKSGMFERPEFLKNLAKVVYLKGLDFF